METSIFIKRHTLRVLKATKLTDKSQWGLGICVAFHSHLSEVLKMSSSKWLTTLKKRRRVSIRYLETLWCRWPKFSGNIHFPVPSPFPSLTARSIFNTQELIWLGEYGALRQELLDWLIKEVVNDIKPTEE